MVCTWLCAWLLASLACPSHGAAAPDCIYDGKIFQTIFQDIETGCGITLGGAISVAWSLRVDSLNPSFAVVWRFGVGQEDNSIGVVLDKNRGVLNFEYWLSPGSAAGEVAHPLAIGDYVRYLATYDGTTMQLFANSVKVAEANTGGVAWASVARTMRLGGDISTAGRQLHGLLEDVYIWNSVVTFADAVLPVVTPTCTHAGRVYNANYDDISASCPAPGASGAVSVAFTMNRDASQVSQWPNMLSIARLHQRNELKMMIINGNVRLSAFGDTAGGVGASILQFPAPPAGATKRFLAVWSKTGLLQLHECGHLLGGLNSQHSWVPGSKRVRVGSNYVADPGFQGSITDVWIFDGKVQWNSASDASTDAAAVDCQWPTTTSVTVTATATATVTTDTATSATATTQTTATMTRTQTSSTSSSSSSSITLTSRTSTLTASVTGTSTSSSSSSSTSTMTSSTSSVSTSLSSTSTSSTSSSGTTTMTSSTSSVSTSFTSTSTTSSSSSGTSTSSTSSSSGSSTSSLTKPIGPHSWQLLPWISFLENGTLDSFRQRGRLSFRRTMPGATQLADNIVAGQSTTLKVAGVEVHFPPSMLGSLGKEQATAVVTVLDADLLDELSPPGAVVGAVNVNLFDGGLFDVEGLPEPLVVGLPNPLMREVHKVVYWREAEEKWSSEGVEVLGSVEGTLRFATTHLTLFAALWKGFVSAIMCAQLGLLSKEGVEALFKGQWFLGPFALLFWMVLLFLSAMCIRAYYLDRLQCKEWSDEWFLIPDDDDGQEEEVGRAQACSVFVESCGSALRDILDDVCSRWCRYFGEMRDLMESLFAEVSGCGGTAFVSSMMASSARRQAATRLGLSLENVDFVLEDEGLNEVLANGLSEVLASRTFLSSLEALDPKSKRFHAWLRLHQEVLDAVMEELAGMGSWHSVPRASAKVFMTSNPIAASMQRCRLMPRMLRMLFYAVELCGSLAFAALFFDGTGMTLHQQADEECGDDKPFWEKVGGILAVALGSIVVAYLPVMLLASLHDRGFKKCAWEGPAWRRQLRLWHRQDRLAWGLGLAYILVCSFYILLFLANIAPLDLPDWGMSSAIQLAEELLFLPAAVALLVPALSTALLRGLSYCQAKTIAEIVSESRLQRQRGGGNWKHFVASV